MYSSSFLSLKIFCIMAFFFWPQLCFENMIFRLHNILQHFYLLWPFLSLALETFKLLPFFPDKIKALSTFFFLSINLSVCLWLFPQMDSQKWNYKVREHVMCALLMSTAKLPFRKIEQSTPASGSGHISQSRVWVFLDFKQESFLKLTFGTCHQPSKMKDE